MPESLAKLLRIATQLILGMLFILPLLWVGILAIAFAAGFGPRNPPDLIVFLLLMFLGGTLVFGVTMDIHELGHAIAAGATGMLAIVKGGVSSGTSSTAPQLTSCAMGDLS